MQERQHKQNELQYLAFWKNNLVISESLSYRKTDLLANSSDKT